MGSPEDLEVMKYFLGRRFDLHVSKLTHFQNAIREYIGNVKHVDEIIVLNTIEQSVNPDNKHNSVANSISSKGFT